MLQMNACCINLTELHGIEIYEYQCYLYGDQEEPLYVVAQDAQFGLTWIIEGKRIENRLVCNIDCITLEECDSDVIISLVFLDENSKILYQQKNISSESLPFFMNNLGINVEEDVYVELIFEVYRQKRSFQLTNCQSRQLENYSQILKSIDKYHDVSFAVGNEKIPAHTEILSAQSMVFSSMFETDMLEKSSGIVNITDIEPSIFKLFIHYIYHGEVEPSDLEDIFKLLSVADKYSVNSLMSVCRNIIMEKITPECFIDVLVRADYLNDQLLKKECVRYLQENKVQVVTAERFERIKSFPNLLFELFCQI